MLLAAACFADQAVVTVELRQQLMLWTACAVLPITVGAMVFAARTADAGTRARAVRTGLALGSGIAAWMLIAMGLEWANSRFDTSPAIRTEFRVLRWSETKDPPSVVADRVDTEEVESIRILIPRDAMSAFTPGDSRFAIDARGGAFGWRHFEFGGVLADDSETDPAQAVSELPASDGASSRGQDRTELILVLASLVPILGIIIVFARWQAVSRFEGFAERLGGRLKLVRLHVDRGGLHFTATAEFFGRIEVLCPQFRTRLALRLRPSRNGNEGPLVADSGMPPVNASEELRAVLVRDEQLRRGLASLLPRAGLRFRTGAQTGGLRAVLRPVGHDLTPQDLSDSLDWFAALHAHLLASDEELAPQLSGGQRPPKQLVLPILRLVASLAWLALVLFGLGRWMQLTSGSASRLVWHSVPVALALGAPACVLYVRSHRSKGPTWQAVTSSLVSLLMFGWPTVITGMVLVNDYLDNSPRVAHEVELLEIHSDEKYASFKVRGWAEDRAVESLPLPDWFEDRLGSGARRVIVEVQPGALGYEHLSALGLPD